jgi:hypothetical protein
MYTVSEFIRGSLTDRLFLRLTPKTKTQPEINRNFSVVGQEKIRRDIEHGSTCSRRNCPTRPRAILLRGVLPALAALAFGFCLPTAASAAGTSSSSGYVVGGACTGTLSSGPDDNGNAYVCKSGVWVANIYAISNGYVGIGTTAPDSLLSVLKAGNGVLAEFGTTAGSTDAAISIWNNVGWAFIGVATTDIYFSPQGTERMRIANSGNVGIGQTNPTFNLDVTGTGRFTGALTVASCTGCSDARLKKDIHPLENSLEKIRKLRGVHFKWREPEEREIAKKLVLPTTRLQTGLIAQDVESVFPELVTKNKDFDGIRANNAEEVKTINYNGLIAPVIEAIKELSHEISQLVDKFNPLKSEVETLKAEVEELKAEVKDSRKKK